MMNPLIPHQCQMSPGRLQGTWAGVGGSPTVPPWGQSLPGRPCPADPARQRLGRDEQRQARRAPPRATACRPARQPSGKPQRCGRRVVEAGRGGEDPRRPHGGDHSPPRGECPGCARCRWPLHWTGGGFYILSPQAGGPPPLPRGVRATECGPQWRGRLRVSVTPPPPRPLPPLTA